MKAGVFSEIRARITLDSSQFTRGTDEARSRLGSVKKDFDGIQKASTVVAGAVAAVVGASVNAAATLEKTLSKVQAVTNASAEDMERMKKAALDYGASTAFSATQVGDSLVYLGQSGLDVNQSLDALPSVLSLAAAGGIGLADSANYVTNIMSGFKIEADETAKVVDILAKAASTANTDVPGMAEAFKMAGPVAASLGFTIEETAAAIGELANIGISGSQAGTVLRASMLQLANPVGQAKKAVEEYGISVLDASGNMKPLPELIGHIGGKLDGMTDAQKTAAAAQLVGTEAASGFIGLLNVGEEGLRDYTTELENAGGTADRMANTQMDNLKGSFEEFSGALETVGITIGDEYLPMFRDMIDAGADVVRWVGELDADLIQQTITFAGVAAGIGVVITTLGKLVGALRLTMAAMGPAGWAVIGLSVVGGILAATAEEGKKLTEVNLELADTMIETGASARDNTAAFEELHKKSKLSTEEFGRFLDIQKELAAAVDDNKIAALTEEQEALREKSGLSNDELERMVGLNGDLVATVPEAAGHITDQGNRVIDATDALRGYNDELADSTIRELERQRIIAEGKEVEQKEKIKELQADLTEGLAKEEEYRKAFNEFDEEATLAKIEQLELEYESGELKGRERQALGKEIEREKEKLSTNREQLTTQMEKNDKKQEEIDKLNAELGLVGEIDQRMIDVLVSQQNINAEKGKEIEAIDKAIVKLEEEKQKINEQTPLNMRNTQEYENQIAAVDEQIRGHNEARDAVIGVYASSKDLSGNLHDQIRAINEKIGKHQAEKRELEKNTAAADRNTDEYRNGVAAIDAQISELIGVRGQIDAAIGSAQSLNSTLGASVNKSVIVRTVGGNSLKNLEYHTGGIVGKKPLNQMPKLHNGGAVAALADRFSQPMQHEMDVRLLKNEMVVTESQQANLMRMIDAGHTNAGSAADFSETNSILRTIAQGVGEGKNVRVVLSDDALFESTQGKLADEIVTKKFTGGLRD